MNWESNTTAAAAPAAGGEMQGGGGDIWLPPGFRFHPTDDELIMFYLTHKVLNNKFSAHAIAEVDLNKYEPWQLPERAKMGEKEWYFFSLRDRKYPTGMRTNRATDAGYWKATGKDRDIYSSGLVGMKKTLVFYRGRAPRGEKTNWVMHEYRLEGKTAYLYGSKASKEEWVVCRIFEKKGSKKNAEEEEQADSQSEMPSSPLPKLVNDSSEVVGPCFDLEDKNEAMYSRLQSNKRQLGSADSENRDFKMCKVEAMDNFKYDGGFDPFKTQFVVPQMQLNFPTEINSSLNDMCAGTPLELHLFTRFLSDPSLPSIELDQLYAY